MQKSADRPLKIAIEAQRIFRKKKHGMDFVALEMIRELQKLDKVNQYYILVSPGEDPCLNETDNFRIIEISCPTYPLWEQWALPRAVRKIAPDLLHCTSNTAPIRNFSAKLVLTLHDIIFMKKRQGSSKSLYQNMGWHYRRFVVPRIIRKCSQIITVSRYESQNIQAAFGLSGQAVVPVYNGYSSHFHPLENAREITRKYIDQQNYIFFLGNTDPKKNTARTLKAYSIYLKKAITPLPLLIADLDKKIIDDILKKEGCPEASSYIYAPGYIPNTDLPAIYSGAFAFLYTSLIESFGIPMLEAMACGTPLITSNVTAMPEIAGEGAILTDPTNPDGIAEQLLRLEKDEPFYQQQVRYGLDRVKEFSWTSTAEECLKIYRQVCGIENK